MGNRWDEDMGCPEDNEVFSGAALFPKGRKAEMLRLAKINIRIEKRPYEARKLCASQGLKFLSFLGLSQDAKLCPFDGVRG